jgi:cyclic-di-GMP phosphodiesterase TipF (flagellum assembly factor)
LARIRLSALPPAASGVAGFSVGAAAMLLLPGGLANAVGLLSAGLGLAGSAVLARRRLVDERDRVLALLGEVKVRMATNAMRVDALAQRLEQSPMSEADAAPSRAMLNELTAEVGLLGDLLQQVATTLGDHDDQIRLMQEKRAAARSERAAPALAVVEPAVPEVLSPVAVREDPAAEARRAAEEERAALIGEALARGQVEVHLQPVVQLPQRRTRGYEALVRLRLDEKTLLMPEEFLAIVEERGFGPTLDALVLTRALAIARHLGGKGGDLFVSCNFSAATWGSSRALAALARILEKYREHAGHLVIEVPQRVFRLLDPSSLGLLGAMSAGGVRFALDQVGDLRFDVPSLLDRGVRLVKVPAALLSDSTPRGAADIAVGDLAALLERGAIMLVAEGVEDDPTVAGMLELGVGYAQGGVFSPPRPVRPEVFAEPAEKPAPQPSPAPAEALPSAEVVDYPAPAQAAPQPPRRVAFRDVLRRASA